MSNQTESKVRYDHKTTVFFDGSCPLCVREIGFVRARVRNPAAIDWVDISQSVGEAKLPDGLSPEAAMKRFHVVGQDGRLVSGPLAFAEIWSHIPGLGGASRLVRLAPVRWALEVGYRVFLLFRPLLQKLAGGRRCETDQCSR